MVARVRKPQSQPPTVNIFCNTSDDYGGLAVGLVGWKVPVIEAGYGLAEPLGGSGDCAGEVIISLLAAFVGGKAEG